MQNRKMTGGIFEVIKLKRKFDEMERERQRTMRLIQKLENEDDGALIRQAL